MKNLQSGMRVRGGFSLVEVLVVIAIIGLLLALILPSVQQARTAARKIQCHNNLHQQGVAIHNHISTWEYFPSGGWGATWLGMSDLGTGKRQPGGWIYNILPYCEQESTHRLAPAFAATSLNPGQVQDFVNVSPSVFVCPERRSAQASQANEELRYFGSLTLTTCAKSDYAINGGTNFFRSIDGPGDLDTSVISQFRWPNTSELNGVSFLRSEIRTRDLTDGSSQVIAVGEKWVGALNTAKSGHDQPLFSGDCLDIRRWAMTSPALDGHELGNESGFGSAHQGSAGFLFCDGSVKLIPYYVDLSVFQKLCARSDGEVFDGEY